MSADASASAAASFPDASPWRDPNALEYETGDEGPEKSLPPSHCCSERDVVIHCRQLDDSVGAAGIPVGPVRCRPGSRIASAAISLNFDAGTNRHHKTTAS